MNARRAAIAALALLLIGGLVYGKKAQVQREAAAHEKLLTDTRGGTAAYGPSTGINGESTGGGEYQQLLQECLGRRKDTKQAVLGLMAKAEETRPAVSRSGDNIDRVSSSYTSLGVFKITAYTAGYESTGKRPGHPEYGITATGATVEEGLTIATDWKVLPPGTIVYIEGLGTRTVQDRGGGVKGNHIDLFIEDLKEAQEWGVQRLEVYLVK